MRSAVLGGALLSTAVLHATARHDAQLPLDPASFMLDHGADDDYSIFTHPSMQEHRLRFKRTDGWCKGADTKSYAGYIDHDDSSLFFYYYESRNKPAEDPVVLWINGGPGCSSSMGMLMELGPCQIDEPTSPNATAATHRNPYSWNTNANLLFLDQPVGVGFSYSRHGRHVGTTEKAAKDVQAFVTLFFEAFSELKGRPFHFAGESYGGRYIPLFAGAILDHNAKAVAGGLTPINLRSVMIGNGLTDELTAIPTYYDQACTNISGAPTGPVLDIHTCALMQSYVPRCETWLKKACLDTHDVQSCAVAQEWCSEQFMVPYMRAKWNPYDVSKPCPNMAEDLCYPPVSKIKEFLDSSSVRKHLGIPTNLGEFEGCNNEVNARFHRAHDDTPIQGTYLYVTALVERGVDALIYNGKYDWICNWKSNEAWLNRLIWSGSKDYLANEMKPWHAKVDGQNRKAGDSKTSISLGGGKLTFATIEAAGHMVPYDQPGVALAMVDRWLKGHSL